VPKPKVKKILPPPVSDAKSGSNEWDDDWDFDEQAVKKESDAKEVPAIKDVPAKEPVPVVDSSQTPSSPILMHQAKVAADMIAKETEEEKLRAKELPTPKELLPQPILVSENTVSSAEPAPLPAKLEKVDVAPPVEVAPDKVVANDWKEDDLDDMYDDDDDSDDNSEEETAAEPREAVADPEAFPLEVLAHVSPVELVQPKLLAPSVAESSAAQDDLIPPPEPTLLDFEEPAVTPTSDPEPGLDLDQTVSSIMPSTAAASESINLIGMKSDVITSPAIDDAVFNSMQPADAPATENDFLKLSRTGELSNEPPASSTESDATEIDPVVYAVPQQPVEESSAINHTPEEPMVEKSLDDEIAGMLDEQSELEEGVFDELSQPEEDELDEQVSQQAEDVMKQSAMSTTESVPTEENPFGFTGGIVEATPVAISQYEEGVSNDHISEVDEGPVHKTSTTTEELSSEDDPFAFSSAIEEASHITDEGQIPATQSVPVEAEETSLPIAMDMAGTNNDGLIVRSHPGMSSEQMIPASVLDQFTNQMQRLEEHHHTEIQELQRAHAQQIESFKSSITHDACKTERIELEKGFLRKLRAKDEQLQEVMHVNEGMKLKMEVLKREVDGTQQLLEERDSEIGSFSAAHDRDKQQLEQKLKSMMDSAGTAKSDIYQIQVQLQSAEDELEQSKEDYSVLKSRVKVVATELKERRAECRTLAQTNMELVDANEQIQTQLTHLKAQSDDQNRSEVEKGEEMDELRDKVKKLEEDLHEAEKKIQARGVVGEKALSAYKKKAQNSLAVANARAAAAMQAREEAELEARAARSTADVAVERARKAEAKGNDALKEAKAYVKDMEQQKADAEGKANTAIVSFSKLQVELDEAKADAKNARAAREKLAKDMTSLNHEHELEKSKVAELQGDLADLQQRSNDLYDEVETLREELRKSATAAFMAQTNDGSGRQTNGGMNGSATRSASQIKAGDKSESEATILILQRDLQDSNQAIKELKETLRSTIENQSKNETAVNASRPVKSEANSSSPKTNGNDSTPLFYAMEKQAELNQARGEINRLATLLGELQSEKMQAYDAVEGMKREKEDAESRLARYEKLGPSGASKRAPSTRTQQQAFGGYGSNVSSRRPDTETLSVGSIDSTDEIEGTSGTSDNSAQVNLEYLKNVMVSYLKAKTLNERKRLLPAVSAVLCLTPEEAAAAMRSVQESGSVESVGMSLFEGLKLM
jgi:hypothetical protein